MSRMKCPTAISNIKFTFNAVLFNSFSRHQIDNCIKIVSRLFEHRILSSNFKYEKSILFCCKIIKLEFQKVKYIPSVKHQTRLSEIITFTKKLRWPSFMWASFSMFILSLL